MRTEEILATIDQALEDWEVSGDAMRWTPHPSAERVHIAEPRQNGRASLHFGGPSRLWFAPSGTQPQRAHMHVDLSGVVTAVSAVTAAFEELSLATGISAQSIAELAAQLESSELGLTVEEVTEDPRARALRLRQQRGTGPTTPRAQTARRPRSHA